MYITRDGGVVATQRTPDRVFLWRVAKRITAMGYREAHKILDRMCGLKVKG